MTKNLPAAYMGSEPYIFVSYSHRDSGEVMKDIAWMVEKGYRVWYDEGIEFGQDFPRELAVAIKNCSQFIIYISPNSINSEYVNREINYAINLKLQVFPIFLEQTNLSEKLDFLISTLQRLDRYRFDWNSFCDYFANGLKKDCIEPVKQDKAKKDVLPTIETYSDQNNDIAEQNANTINIVYDDKVVSANSEVKKKIVKLSGNEKWFKTKAFRVTAAVIALLAIIIQSIIIVIGNSANSTASYVSNSSLSETATPKPIKKAIEWKELNIKKAVRDYLEKPTGDIFVSDLNGITSIFINGDEITFNIDVPNSYENKDGKYSSRAEFGTISSLSDLKYFSDMQEITIFDNPISDISGLSELKNLTFFDSYNTDIKDISVLSDLTNLKHLSLIGSKVSDLSALSGLKNLSELFIWSKELLSDISAISRLKKLRVLYLFKYKMNDISALSGLTNLTELSLYGNQISDISALSGLKKLISLEIITNQIIDISVLTDLNGLETLVLSYNQITDISALSGLTHLKKLDLNNNKISNISALSKLVNLKILNLGSNQIDDISSIANLVNLDELYIDQNPVKDYSPLKVFSENVLITK